MVECPVCSREFGSKHGCSHHITSKHKQFVLEQEKTLKALHLKIPYEELVERIFFGECWILAKIKEFGLNEGPITCPECGGVFEGISQFRGHISYCRGDLGRTPPCLGKKLNISEKERERRRQLGRTYGGKNLSDPVVLEKLSKAMTRRMKEAKRTGRKCGFFGRKLTQEQIERARKNRTYHRGENHFRYGDHRSYEEKYGKERAKEICRKKNESNRGKHKPWHPIAKYDDGIGNKLRTQPELTVAFNLQDMYNRGIYRTVDDVPYHYEKKIKMPNGSIRFPDFTLVMNPKVLRIEFSGAFRPYLLRKAILRGMEIKENDGDDLYVIITYEEFVTQFPDDCADKIIDLEQMGKLEEMLHHMD